MPAFFSSFGVLEWTLVIVAALLVFSPKMPEGQALHKAGTGKEERTL